MEDFPGSDIDGFYVFDGGLGSDSVERWNVVEVMLRGGNVWIWWNGLLIPPNPTLSAALPSPVEISSPYFVAASGRVYGKYAMRLWPGAKVRRTEVRAQPRVFSEFTYSGQLTVN